MPRSSRAKRSSQQGNKSAKQVRFLLSGGSPLTSAERERLRRELHQGKVKVKKGE